MSQYTVGTVSITNGSNVVTGTGTLWLANVSVGDWILFNATTPTYQIAGITSNIDLTLTANYSGLTLPTASYIAHKDYTSPYNLPLLSQNDLETSEIFSRAMRLINDQLVVAGNTITLPPVDFVNLIADNLSTPPGSPVLGDVYILNAAGAGAWTGYANNDIAVWDGSAWVNAGAKATGDRFIVSGLSTTIASGSFVGLDDTIQEWTGASWLSFSIGNGVQTIILDTNSQYTSWRVLHTSAFDWFLLDQSGILSPHNHLEVDITDLQAYLTDLTGEGFGTLSDVNITTITDNDVIQYDTATSEYINRSLAVAGISAVGHAHVATDITDFNAAVDARIGGGSLINVVDDLTPQLGGNLDVNSFSLVSVAAGNILITPDTTGVVVLDGMVFPKVDGTNGQHLQTNGAGVMAWAAGAGLGNIVEDTTPQLGADLDVNSNGLVSTSNGDITCIPNGTGKTKVTNIEAPLNINAQTGTTYTGVLSDAEKMITMSNASANTFTIPANTSVAYPIGTKLNFEQLGAGATTIAITTDTLNVNASLTLVMDGQYSVATAFKNTATTWTLFGMLVAV